MLKYDITALRAAFAMALKYHHMYGGDFDSQAVTSAG